MLRLTICLFILGMAMFFGTDAALAASPFESAVSDLQQTFITVFQIIAVIAIMAVGVGCLCGKINKIWLIGCVVGIILVFGAEQIVTWIRSAAGV